VIVTPFLFHLLMAPSGLPIAIIVVILWFILFFRNRQYLSALFVQRAT
jgi:putative oxidoreductase